MSSREFKKSVFVVALCATLLFGGMSQANAQQTTPESTAVRLVRGSNGQADSRYNELCVKWRTNVSQLGSKTNLMKMAKTLASLNEKIAQGADLFDSSKKGDRMQMAFRKHVVDIRKLARSMSESFETFQNQLMDESLELCRRGGIDPKVAEAAFARYSIDGKSWESAFDPLLRKAKSLAQEDWFRLAAVTAGSGLAADGLMDLAKGSGVWKPKSGSLEEIVGGLLTHLFIEAVAEELTDPSEEFAKKLQSEFKDSQRRLLDGRNGLLTAVKSLTDIHKQTRSKLFGLNGGK